MQFIRCFNKVDWLFTNTAEIKMEFCFREKNLIVVLNYFIRCFRASYACLSPSSKVRLRLYFPLRYKFGSTIIDVFHQLNIKMSSETQVIPVKKKISKANITVYVKHSYYNAKVEK